MSTSLGDGEPSQCVGACSVAKGLDKGGDAV